jgi:hypothetical protein
MGVVYELGGIRLIEMAIHVVYRDTPGEWVLRAAAGGVEGVTVDHAPNVAWTLDPLDRPSRQWLYCGKCGAGPPLNTKAIRLALANRRRVLPL